MEQPADFGAVLRTFMAQAARTNRDLAQLTGISVNTIENWTDGEVRRPRFVTDVLKLARALALNAHDTTTLLTAAGRPPLAQIQAQAQQTGDTALAAVLAFWEGAPPPAAHLQIDAAPTPPRIAYIHQLRPPVADFVGRAQEADRLVVALRAEQAAGRGAIIAGIQGMGGIGKTELAYYIADHVRAAFPDVQIVLNLQGASAVPLTAVQAVQTVIQALNPELSLPEELPALEQHYRTLLHDRRALILADDARDAAQVRPLIPPRGCALLITSRQRFTLPGLVSINLELLGTGEATALLHQVCPRLSVEEAHAIAHACDHLPLALRISGGILHNDPALPVATYIQRLADEQQRLTHLRDPDDAHLDVAASLALSYALLDDPAQQVFRQLGVFVANFATPLALEVVRAGAGVDVEAQMRLLLRRNLVMYDSERARWRLHDLVRDVARRQLDAAGETEATQWHYARAAVRLAQATQEQYIVGGEGSLAALTQFDTERPHIDAGQRWMTDHAGTPEGDQLLVNVATAIKDIGVLRYDVQHDIIPQWERALAAAQRLGDCRAEGLALNALGAAYTDLGDTRHALPYYEQYLIIVRAMGDRYGEGSALGNLGNAYLDLGDARRAIPYYEQVLAIFQAIGDRRREGMTLGNLGSAYLELGDACRALPYYAQDLTIAHELGDLRSEGYALSNLGNAYTALGDAQRAIAYYDQALTIFRTLGDQHGEGYTLSNLGTAYTALGRARQAIDSCEVALTMMRAIGDRRMEGYALSNLACAEALQGDTAHAATVFEQGVGLLHTVGARWGEAECQWQFGLALARRGVREQALPLLRAALTYKQAIGHAQAEEHAELVARLELGDTLPAALRAREAVDEAVLGREQQSARRRQRTGKEGARGELPSP